jgi:hypothetical protein
MKRKQKAPCSPWEHAGRGMMQVCRMRMTAEEGKLKPGSAAFWSVAWRRTRLAVLVKHCFICDECFAGIDPDKPFGVRHRTPGETVTPATPAADLVPVCHGCRKHWTQGTAQDAPQSTGHPEGCRHTGGGDPSQPANAGDGPDGKRRQRPG